MTATDLARLHRGILEDPADDALRLIYADALEDDGQTERAGFVRDQVMWLDGSNDIDYLDAHLERWCPWFARHEEKGFCRWFGGPACGAERGLKAVHARGEITKWSRGFICSVTLPLAAFMENAEALFRAHPITSVTLSDRVPHLFLRHGESPPFGWLISAHYERRDTVPKRLYRCLPGGEKVSKKNLLPATRYVSRGEWDAALSAACVRLGRRLAGLPTMPFADATA